MEDKIIYAEIDGYKIWVRESFINLMYGPPGEEKNISTDFVILDLNDKETKGD